MPCWPRGSYSNRAIRSDRRKRNGAARHSTDRPDCFVFGFRQLANAFAPDLSKRGIFHSRFRVKPQQPATLLLWRVCCRIRSRDRRSAAAVLGGRGCLQIRRRRRRRPAAAVFGGRGCLQIRRRRRRQPAAAPGRRAASSRSSKAGPPLGCGLAVGFDPAGICGLQCCPGPSGPSGPQPGAAEARNSLQSCAPSAGCVPSVILNFSF